jgi:adenosylcobalamin-dependent ribonucleoside-triphosphate reductase
LQARAKKKVRPIDCLDIMNIIGFIVVSGNVRRSAQIAIGDYDDFDFLNAKRWDLGNIPNWRAMSNNSVVCDNFAKLPEAFWNGYEGKGEPYGLINLKLSRKMGRLGDTRYPDPDVAGYNPCAEQSLADKETCALGEVFLPNITSKDQLTDVVKLLYRIIKHSLALPCHLKETEAVVHKHMRMGIGVTGYLQATDEQRSWLSDVYEDLRSFDVTYSKKHGWPESIKLTTCKPSGTLSLLAGVTSGVHPGYSRHFIRRIRISSSSPLVDLCRQHGFPVEYQVRFDGTDDHNTVVVSFPCKHDDHVIVAKDVTAIEQMEWVKKLQTDWSDNSVSCTVYYRKEELPAIRQWLSENYDKCVKTISFLLHSDHGFAQAPLEEITEEQYLEMLRSSRPINGGGEVQGDEFDGDGDCAGGACPVR